MLTHQKPYTDEESTLLRFLAPDLHQNEIKSIDAFVDDGWVDLTCLCVFFRRTCASR